MSRSGVQGFARRLDMDSSRRPMEVIVERKAQRILGGAVFGIEGSPITSPVQITMTGKLPCRTQR